MAKTWPSREEVIASTPFGTLLHFRKATGSNHPRILVVPAMAGHFATLIRGTLRTLLADHDVFVADWHNARDVPADDGRFGLDEYIAHVIDFLDAIGPGTHLMAVCQPCAAVVAAASLMAEDEHPAQPASLILMAGPIDARVNPGRVNEFATKASLSSLERKFVTMVPRPHKGAGRKVYPGFLQALAFISLAPERHLSAFIRLPGDIVRGSDAAADTHEGILRGVLRRPGCHRRVLPRHCTCRLQGSRPRARPAVMARPARESRRNLHCVVDHRSRER